MQDTWGRLVRQGARRGIRQLAPSRPSWLAVNPKGGGGRVARGMVVDHRTAALLYPPSPAGGEAGFRAGLRVQEEGPHPTTVNSRLMKTGCDGGNLTVTAGIWV